jgi:hypothetical protein
LQGFLLQVDEAEIVVHEADEPNAVVDFLDAEALTGETVEMLTRLRCMQMRPQAVTSTSRSCSGSAISGSP